MRRSLIHRAAASLVPVLCCLLGLPKAPTWAADNTVPYYNLAHAYAFTYPASWIRLRVAGADYAVVAPDLNGVLSVTVGPGAPDDTVLRKALRAAFIPFGRPIHPIQLGTHALQGAVALQAQTVVRTPAHRQCAITVLAVSHRRRIYVILLVVQDIQQASAGADSQALEAALASFALF